LTNAICSFLSYSNSSLLRGSGNASKGGISSTTPIGGIAGAYIMGGGIIIIPRCIGCGSICNTGFIGSMFDGNGMGNRFSTGAMGSISGIVTAKGRSVVGGGGFTRLLACITSMVVIIVC